MARLTNEDKRAAGMVHWHAELHGNISHEGYVSDGDCVIHAWFDSSLFDDNIMGDFGIVENMAVIELHRWSYVRNSQPGLFTFG